jgi:hypothetical protein
MSRSSIRAPTQDLQSDPGSVLYSFVQGEQTSQEVALDFLLDAAGYEYEAVIMEADNVEGLPEVPTKVKPLGKADTLVTRVRTDRGNWSPGASYNHDDLVSYLGAVYRLASNRADGYTNEVVPPEDSRWIPSAKNIVIIHFHKLLSSDYAVQPTLDTPVYGFIELSVTEDFGVFPQIWKPLRGAVSFSFSPTKLV